MPADRRSGRVLDHHAFDQRGRYESGERSGALTNRKKKFRKVFCGSGCARGEVIFQAELKNAAAGSVAVKVEVGEWECAKGVDELGFFGFGEEVGLVEKALGKVGRGKE